jgi:V8-like Glu-specific endopeptidase
MKLHLIVLFALLLATKTYGQKTVLVFDLVNGTVDSITNLTYDSTILSAQTNFHLGNLNSNIETLEQTPPVSNVYFGTEFTLKRQASLDYDLTNFPIRTSIKLFAEENDTLKNNCSGSMISRRHVLTAAHCVSGINTSSLNVDSLYVCPVYDNGDFSADFNCSYVQKVYFFRDWSLNGEDFAVLELEEAIGETTGWIGIGFNATDSLLTQGIFYKFSYPSISLLSIDTNEYNGDTLYYNYGVSDFVNPNFIGILNTNGIPGESGSSIIKVENGSTYTTYGALSYSTNLQHSRLDNWEYYAIESIIHDDLVVGIPEPINAPELEVFPNPTTGQVWLQNIKKREILELTLIDNLGRTILSKRHFNPEFSLSLSTLPEGIYYIKVVTNNATITRKIIKSS